MTIERIDFHDPLIISSLSEGLDGKEKLWEADVFKDGYTGQITRTMLASGSYQVMPDFLERTASYEWRMKVNVQGEGELTSKPAGSDHEPEVGMRLPQQTPVFPVLTQNEEATHSIVSSMFVWHLGPSPEKNITTEETGYKFDTAIEKLYPESIEDWRSDEYTFNAPAQYTFEVFHAMSGQLADESGRFGDKIEGQERVVEKLLNSIPQRFLKSARPGVEIEKDPVLSELQLSYLDLEVIGKSLLSLPTEKQLIDSGISPEAVKGVSLIRKICLSYYFIFDTLFEASGGEPNISLSTKAHEEFTQ